MISFSFKPFLLFFENEWEKEYSVANNLFVDNAASDLLPLFVDMHRGHFISCYVDTLILR